MENGEGESARDKRARRLKEQQNRIWGFATTNQDGLERKGIVFILVDLLLAEWVLFIGYCWRTVEGIMPYPSAY